MAVDLSSVLNANREVPLVVNEDVSNILLRKRKRGLWAFALTSHVQSESFLRAGGVAEGGAAVVVGTLRPEGDAARDLGAWPDLTLQRLDGKDLVLEQHGIVVNRLSDALVLPAESGNSLLLVPLTFELELILVVRVIRVKTIVHGLVQVLRLQNTTFLVLLSHQLLVQSGLLLYLFLFG